MSDVPGCSLTGRLVGELAEAFERLGLEIRDAMDAIAANQLPLFEAGVKRQEALCEKLQTLTQELNTQRVAFASGSASTWRSASGSTAAGLRPVCDVTPDARRAPSAEGADRAHDPAMSERLRSAATALQALNLQYAALLRHSGESIRLLAGVSPAYAGQLQPKQRKAGLKTWSCEV